MAPQITGSIGSHGPGSSDDNSNTRRRLDELIVIQDFVNLAESNSVLEC